VGQAFLDDLEGKLGRRLANLVSEPTQRRRAGTPYRHATQDTSDVATIGQPIDPAVTPGWRCRRSTDAGSTRAPPATRSSTREEVHVRRLHARAAGGRGPLRPPDPPLESQDAPLHLHGAGRDLHHRPPADPAAARGST